MTQPPAVHFDVFKNLCGNDFQGRILLVMTMWERVKPDVRETRKKVLTRNWGYPSSVVQHMGTQESAWDIVRNLLDTRDTTRDAAKNLSNGLNTVYDTVPQIRTSLFRYVYNALLARLSLIRTQVLPPEPALARRFIKIFRKF